MFSSLKSKHPTDHKDRQGACLVAAGFDALDALVEVEVPGAGLHVIDTRHNPAAEDRGEVERTALDGENRYHLERTAEGVGARCGLQGEDEVHVGLGVGVKPLLNRHAPDGTGAVNDVEAVDRYVGNEGRKVNSSGGHTSHLSATPFSPGEKDVVRRLLDSHPKGLRI